MVRGRLVPRDTAWVLRGGLLAMLSLAVFVLLGHGSLAQQPRPGIAPRDMAQAEGFAQLLRERVDAHLAAGRTLQAVVTLRRWHEREPANLDVACELAAVTLRTIRTTLSRHGTRQDVHEASRVFHDALDHVFERDEAHPEANRLLAEYLLRVHGRPDLEVALRAAQLAERGENQQPVVDDDDHAWRDPPELLLALAYERGDDVPAAAAALAPLLEAAPEHFEALSVAFRLHHNHREALQAAQQQDSIEGFPTHFEICERVINHQHGTSLRHPAAFAGASECVRIGDALGAVRLMELAGEHSDNVTIQLAQRLLRRYHDREVPGRVVRPALDRLSRNPLVWSADDELAIRTLLDEVEGDDNQDVRLPELHALLALVIHRDNGEPVMRSQLAREPFERFRAALANDDDGDAEESLREYPRLIELAAEIALNLDELAKAVQHYRTLEELGPERTRVERRLRILAEAHELDVPAAAVRHYLEAREHPGAAPARRVPLLTAALEVAPDYPAANYLRARIAFNEQLEYETAATHYRRALDGFEPEQQRWLDSVRGLGIALLFVGGDEALVEAAQLLAVVEEHEGKHPTLTHFRMLIDEIQAGEVVHGAYVAYYEAVAASSDTAALERLERAFDLQPSLFEVVRLKGQRALGDAVELLTELRDEVDRSTFDEKADRMSEAFAEAERLFRQAHGIARRDDQRAEALTFRARTLYLNFESSLTQDEVRQRRADLETCRDLLEQALELDPASESAAMLLGEIFARDGDFVGTHESFRRLLHAKPEAALFEERRSGFGGPRLELPEVEPQQAEQQLRLALSPRFREGQRLRYRLFVEMAGYPRADGSISEPRRSEIRLDVIVREVRAPGYFVAEIEPIALRGDTVAVYEPLLDRRFSAEVSTLLGRIDWRTPQPPRLPEETEANGSGDENESEEESPQERQQRLRQFHQLADQFSSFVAPALFEAWCYDPGRAETAVGERWGKREASGLLQVGAGIPMESRDSYVLSRIHQEPVNNDDNDDEATREIAEVHRRATVGGEVYGEWGRLESRFEVDTHLGQVRSLELELMMMHPDPTYIPPRTQRFMNAEDYTETTLRLELELRRAE